MSRYAKEIKACENDGTVMAGNAEKMKGEWQRWRKQRVDTRLLNTTTASTTLKALNIALCTVTNWRESSDLG